MAVLKPFQFNFLERKAEEHSETSHTSKMEVFAKTVNGFSTLTIFAKNSNFRRSTVFRTRPWKVCGQLLQVPQKLRKVDRFQPKKQLNARNKKQRHYIKMTQMININN